MANETSTTDFGDTNGGAMNPPNNNGNSSATSDSGNAPANSLTNLKEQAVGQGQALLSQTREAAGQAFDSAKGQLKGQLSARKDDATNSLESAVRALEATGQQFRDQDLSFVAGYADSLTDQVRQLTGYLQNKDIDDLTRDVESFARRNPAVFIGGAFLLGLAAARFLKSSNVATNSPFPTSVPRDLVPLDGDVNLPVPLSDSRNFTTGGQIEPGVYGERPVAAHGYVPGVGVSKTNSTP